MGPRGRGRQSSSRIHLFFGSRDSVSCLSTTFCVAVDDVGNAVIYNGGSSWTVPAPARRRPARRSQLCLQQLVSEMAGPTAPQ